MFSMRLQCTVYFMTLSVSRDSSVDIAVGYKLDGRSSFTCSSQTGSETSICCCLLKGLEGSGRDLIEEISRHLHEGTEEYVKILSQDSRYPGRDSNRTSPEHKARSSPLH
jgi:hypothetical protein